MSISINEAEKRVFSIIFNDQEAQDTIFATLKSVDFSTEKHVTLFGLMNDLYTSGTLIDYVTVQNEIEKRKKTNIVDSSYLTELIAMFASSSSIESYIKIINESSIRTRLTEHGKKVSLQSSNQATDIKEILWKIEQDLLDISKKGRTSEFKNLKEVTENVYEKIKHLEGRDITLTGTSSGFLAIDEITNGFQAGDLVILAARPGMGKTAFALNLLINAAKDLKPGEVVVMFSLEMGADQLVMRMLSSESQISQSDLRTGKVRGRWAAINQAIEELQNLSIMIDDSTTLSILDIYAKLKKLSNSKKIKLVVVDYLQLLRGDGAIKNRENRQQEVAQISRLLKSYARDFSTPFIVLAQLNREAEKRGTSKPLLADLRESGAIEQDADIVSFLITPNNYSSAMINKDKNNQTQAPIDNNKAEYIIAKNRNGATKEIPLMVDLTTGTFGNWGN